MPGGAARGQRRNPGRRGHVGSAAISLPHTDTAMLLLRFLFRSVLFWLVTRLLGRFLPILRRLMRI